MTTQALVLADRNPAGLEPLAGDLLPALVPAGGKPLIQHCLEDLWEAGIREVLVASPVGDRTIRAELGDGRRFGLTLRYVESSGQQRPSEVLALAGEAAKAPLVVARGDVLHGRCTGALLARAAAIDADIVPGTIGSRPAGIALLRRQCMAIDQLDWSVVRAGTLTGSPVEFGDIGLALLDSLADLFNAGLEVIDGGYAGLLIDGRPGADPCIAVAPRASIARSVHAGGIARVGRGAELHDEVELAGRVEVGDRCVIDAGAQLIDAIVLPRTYVGRGVRLQNAIASGAWLYRADLGTCQRIDDPLLLAGPSVAATAA